ncbi:hypothetical protein [Clostridium moutaii]|uniref:hypothetical protein n=1 Tax=Clostridium moutaii TaxID=3240932 RepID=UPI0035108727
MKLNNLNTLISLCEYDVQNFNYYTGNFRSGVYGEKLTAKQKAEMTYNMLQKWQRLFWCLDVNKRF